MSDPSMAGNIDDQDMGGQGTAGQDPDLTGQGMDGNADDQGMDKPSQAEGDMGDDGMSGTESGSSTTTS
jgi:hypothetical protein